jgi:MFS family permease
VLRHPVLRKIVACTGTANLFGSMGTALEIVFLIRVLRIRPADTGLLIAVASLGGVAGGLLAGRLGRRIGSARIIWYSMLVLSFPELLIPLAAPGWRVAAFPVGMAFFAFGAVVYNVAQVSYRQSICPPRLLGRMNAAVRWVVWGTIPLGGVIGGALGTLAGVRVTLWIAYSGSWAVGWWVFFSPLRRQRDLAAQRDPEEQPDLEDHRAPGSGIPGQGGRKRPDGTGPQLGD